MTEEKKEVESTKEEVKTSTEEETTSKEEFEKTEETVSANKYNQTLRKLREIELEKRELEKKIPPASSEEEKEEEKETPDVSAIVDEKIKPVLETFKKREEDDKRKDRNAFFETHPEYREDSEKWSGLLDKMDEMINPNSGSYYEQLSAAHLLFAGQDVGDTEVADKKKEMSGDAIASGAGAQKSNAKEEFTPDDRKTMKAFNVSEDGMKAFKNKIKDGSMQILG